MEGASMSVKELKEALEALGTSYAGCIEKQDLMDLLETARATCKAEATGEGMLARAANSVSCFVCVLVVLLVAVFVLLLVAR